jgi:hypothetical protein
MSNLEMLSPQNHAIALIDYQPAMYEGVQSHDRGPHHREFRAAGWDGRSQDLGHDPTVTNARLVLVEVARRQRKSL